MAIFTFHPENNITMPGKVLDGNIIYYHISFLFCNEFIKDVKQ